MISWKQITINFLYKKLIISLLRHWNVIRGDWVAYTDNNIIKHLFKLKLDQFEMENTTNGYPMYRIFFFSQIKRNEDGAGEVTSILGKPKLATIVSRQLLSLIHI